MVSLTIFKSIFDNKTHRRLDLEDFDQFESLLYKMSEVDKKSKDEAQLICPATYEKDKTRANANVQEWVGWAAVDVDDFECDGDLQTELMSRFGHYRWVCYSTASSKEELPKFRLVFPLRENVPADKIKHFWYALQSELGDLGDKQTKDLSRMYYIPAKYDGAYNFIFSNRDAQPIDPSELMMKWEYFTKSTLEDFFSDSFNQKILQRIKDELTNDNVHWTSYRDCPFFPKQLASEYRMITNTGWYHKMYQIMVAIAGNAVKKKYPITSEEISTMCREFDMETGNWYENRPMDVEADRALEYVYKNV